MSYESAPVLRVSLRSPSQFGTRLLWAVGVGFIIALWAFERFFFVAPDVWPSIVLLVCGGILGPFLLFGFFSKPRPTYSIEVHPEFLRLPFGAGRGEMLEVPYTSITTLFLQRRGRRGFLWLGTGIRNFVFPVALFTSAEDAGQLLDALRTQIANLPDGAQRLRVFDAQSESSGAVFSKPLIASGVIVALLLLAYIAQHLGSGFQSSFGLVRFGANAPMLVKEGELYRLFCAGFLHSDVIHLAIVVGAIIVLGGTLERLLGSLNFALLFFASLLLGHAALLTTERVFAVGASPAVFGLVGAFAFIVVTYRLKMPSGVRLSVRWWWLAGGLSLMVGLFAPIDPGAHLGGLFAGVVVCGALLFSEPPLPLAARPKLWSGVAFALLFAGFVWGGHQGISAFLSGSEAAELDVADSYLKLNTKEYALLNRFAWESAIAKDSSPRRLDVGMRAANLALKRVSGKDSSLAIKDTKASLHYRRKELDEAIALEQEVLAGRDDAFIASQLARFLKAKDARPKLGARFELVGEGEGLKVHTYFDTPLLQDTVFYALVEQKGRLLGLMRMSFRSGKETQRQMHLKELELKTGWLEGARLSGALSVKGLQTWGAWPLDERASNLP